MEIQRVDLGASNDRRKNNFTAVRVIATFFVFAGHMGCVMGESILTLCGISLNDLGVILLFLESGYLITLSWNSDPHPLRYAIRRFLRLWPPLAVMVLAMVYIAGPLLSDLGRDGYFQSWYTLFLNNLRLYIVFAQPGVFAEQPVAYATNGSLWTLPIEAVMYVVTPLLFVLLMGNRKKRLPFPAMAVVTVLACGVDLFFRTAWNGRTAIFYATDWIKSYHLAVMYIIGMFYTCEEVRRYLNQQAAFAALAFWLMLQPSSGPLRYLLLYLILPYVVFSFALAPKPLFANLGKKMELSYGIYLYGFFFEQLVLFLERKYGISLGYLPNLFLSLVPTLAAALLSYYLVERPVRKLTRFLTRRPHSGNQTDDAARRAGRRANALP